MTPSFSGTWPRMVSPADSSPPMAILSSIDELADVLEAHRRLVERNLVVLGQRVDQVGGGHALGHAVLPAARLHQVVEEQRDDVVGLDEGAVAIHDAEAVRVAVGGDAQRRADLLHLLLSRRPADGRPARAHGRRKAHRGSRGPFQR